MRQDIWGCGARYQKLWCLVVVLGCGGWLTLEITSLTLGPDSRLQYSIGDINILHSPFNDSFMVQRALPQLSHSMSSIEGSMAVE